MTTHTTQTTELPKHIDVIARSLVNNLFQDVDNTGEIYTELANAICDIHARKFAQTLETEIQKAVEAERKRWHSPFDGLEIKLMYRDGDKVLQNKHIFSLEQISFVKGFFEVVQLKFSYMLKDLLANSLSHKEQA